jgi:hypothetical protein
MRVDDPEGSWIDGPVMGTKSSTYVKGLARSSESYFDYLLRSRFTPSTLETWRDKSLTKVASLFGRAMMLRAPSSVTMAPYHRVPEPSWISQQWEKLPCDRLELFFLAAVLLFLVAAVPALLLGLYLAVQRNRMFLLLNLHGEHIEGKGIGLLRAASVIFIVFGKSNWVAPYVSMVMVRRGRAYNLFNFQGPAKRRLVQWRIRMKNVNSNHAPRSYIKLVYGTVGKSGDLTCFVPRPVKAHVLSMFLCCQANMLTTY